MDNTTLTPPQKLQQFMEQNGIQIALAGLMYPVVDGTVDMTKPQPQIIVTEVPKKEVQQAAVEEVTPTT